MTDHRRQWNNEPTDFDQTRQAAPDERPAGTGLGSLNITGGHTDPGTAGPALAHPAGGLAGREPGRAAPRHLPPRGALRAPGRFVIAIKETVRARGPARIPHAAQAGPAGRALRGAGSRHHRPHHADGDAAGPGAGHPAPEVLPALPCLVLPEAAPGHLTRLIDAQALLLVRLHLVGFYWGDVSLSNTLFRRDAGAFAAYLVDAETGELYPDLSTGQREYDLEIARVNIAGELMDLLEGGLIEEKVDPVATSELIMKLPPPVGRADRARNPSNSRTAGASAPASAA